MKHTRIRSSMVAGAAAVLVCAFCVAAPAAQAVETCFGMTPTVTGTEGDDTIDGTAFRGDVIVGLGGNDVITGLAGDVICAGDGDDHVVWDPGSTDPGDAAGLMVDAGPGDDTVDAGYLGLGVLFGGTGDDELSGGRWGNTMFGGPGNDSLTGSDDPSPGFHIDILRGGSGNDILRGGRGQDTLFGGLGRDNIRGGSGQDTLYGGPGGDTLRGGRGDDLILGGKGREDTKGGRGIDTCRSPKHAPGCNP